MFSSSRYIGVVFHIYQASMVVGIHEKDILIQFICKDNDIKSLVFDVLILEIIFYITRSGFIIKDN